MFADCRASSRYSELLCVVFPHHEYSGGFTATEKVRDRGETSCMVTWGRRVEEDSRCG